MTREPSRDASGEQVSDPPEAPGDSPPPRIADQRRGARQRRRVPVWQESILLVAMALILALILKTFFIQAFYIPSGSMRNTLHVNDRILVEKWSYWFGDVKRGDIVVFDDPDHWLAEEDALSPSNMLTKVLAKVGLYPTGGHLVKRVIGIGGDTVACTRAGVLKVNGQPLAEHSYVTLARTSCDTPFRVIVPTGHLWVMGDNRRDSADSRAHQGDPGGGFIPEHDVVGKVFVIVWPPRHWAVTHKPGIFDNRALDRAATVISVTTPVGAALLVFPFLPRRTRRRGVGPRG
jgi:signal peptidase I